MADLLTHWHEGRQLFCPSLCEHYTRSVRARHLNRSLVHDCVEVPFGSIRFESLPNYPGEPFVNMLSIVGEIELQHFF